MREISWSQAHPKGSSRRRQQPRSPAIFSEKPRVLPRIPHRTEDGGSTEDATRNSSSSSVEESMNWMKANMARISARSTTWNGMVARIFSRRPSHHVVQRRRQSADASGETSGSGGGALVVSCGREESRKYWRWGGRLVVLEWISRSSAPRPPLVAGPNPSISRSSAPHKLELVIVFYSDAADLWG